MSSSLHVQSCVPLLARALIKPLKTDRTKGGLYVVQNQPDAMDFSASMFCKIGLVLDPGMSRISESGAEIPVHVVKGDKVLYFSDKAIDIQVGDEELDIVSHPALVAKVEYEEVVIEEEAPAELPEVKEEPKLVALD